MFAHTDTIRALKQVHRVIKMLRCKEEICRMWMYRQASECDNALPTSRLQVTQPSTCTTRPSLGVQVGYAWWEAQLVINPDVSFLQAISCSGGSELCIVRMPDALLLFRVANDGLAGHTIASCAWGPRRGQGRSIHRCSFPFRYSHRCRIEWPENIVHRVLSPVTLVPRCVM
jgi:hypothetical protein